MFRFCSILKKCSICSYRTSKKHHRHALFMSISASYIGRQKAPFSADFHISGAIDQQPPIVTIGWRRAVRFFHQKQGAYHMKTADINALVDAYNQDVELALDEVMGDVMVSHSPQGLEITQAANDNEQLSFAFMEMAEAVVAMRGVMAEGDAA